MLVMQPPLSPRLFHSKQAVDDYNAAVAAYLAQQQQAEYAHTKTSKRSKQRRERYTDDN